MIPATDSYSQNSGNCASKLTWDAQHTAEIEGTAFSGDNDYFELVAEKADPILFSGSYTAPSGSTLQLRRVAQGPAGNSLLDVTGNRKNESESFAHWFDITAPGSQVRVQLWPSGSGCASYRAKLEAAACTDAYEDNDKAGLAKLLPAGQRVEVTSISTDDDYYDLSEVANGAVCTFDYAVPTGWQQQLRVNVYNTAGSGITNGLGGTTTASGRSLTVSWGADRGPAKLHGGRIRLRSVLPAVHDPLRSTHDCARRAVDAAISGQQ